MKSGNRFGNPCCLKYFKLRLIVSVHKFNLEYRGRERQRNEKEGDRLAKLNEKKSVRELEREIETKESNFAGRTT